MRCGDFRQSYAEDMSLFESPLPRVLLAGLLVFLLVLPGFASTYWLDVLSRIFIAIIAATGLNVVTGYTGLISLGTAAFLAVGGFATAAMAGKAGLPFVVVIPLSGLLTALVGLVFGIPSLRLKGLYLAVATLAAHYIVEFIVTHWDAMTGGVNGISVPPAHFAGLALSDDRSMYYLILPVMVGLLFFTKNLFRTKVGKAFVAIRDQDISAEVMGVDVFRYKLLSFAVSSFIIGVAGSLLAYQARLISPENFPITLAIDYLGMVIIGGLGSILGSIFGAIFITLLPEMLRLATDALGSYWPSLMVIVAPIKTGVFGLVVVLFLIFEPDGMAARWNHIKAYWKLYPFSY
ncbi:MAG: branched-chain amino acid ABC transporter permease [Deltaproteobacteria bacterium]